MTIIGLCFSLVEVKFLCDSFSFTFSKVMRLLSLRISPYLIKHFSHLPKLAITAILLLEYFDSEIIGHDFYQIDTISVCPFEKWMILYDLRFRCTFS